MGSSRRSARGRLAKSRVGSWVRGRIKESAIDLAFDTVLPAVYARAARQPIEAGKALFVAQSGPAMPDDFALVFARLRDAYGLDCRFVSLGRERGSRTAYLRNCARMLRQAATARYVFLNDAVEAVSCVDMRTGTDVVQLWHACGAFKKFGMSTADKRFGGTRAEKLRHPLYGNTSLVTVSSPEVCWAYREAMVLEHRPSVVAPLGVSRTDVYFDAAFRELSRSLVRSLLPCGSRRIALYAPTFRGSVKGAWAPDALDVRALRAAIGDEWFLVVKHHPWVADAPAIPPDCADFACPAPARVAIDELLCAADALVSDYSSLVFEYALLARPMVFFAYDIDEYDEWRGFYYDYDEMTPGPVVGTTAELAEYLAHVSERFDPVETAAFRDRFMCACDGYATGRICDAVLALGARGTLPEGDGKGIAVSDGSPADAGSGPGGGVPDISIVIAAYNAQGTLARAIDSVLLQTHPLSRIEVIVVDDCSGDSTASIAHGYAERHPGIVVATSTPAPSGSPSAPRNLGLSLAHGEYVFFLDADDWLGEEAVARMLAHAREWGSDLLLVKLRGEGGRLVPQSMFKGNQPAVDVFRSKVLWSFGPYKLYRRSLVEDLRFPPFMPEDISFVLRAYVAAGTVSVAADYDYYHLAYVEGGNISLSTWEDVDSNLEAYADVFGFIDANVAPRDRNGVLLRRLFKRDVCNTLRTIASESDISKAHGQLLRLSQVVAPYYRPWLFFGLPREDRALLKAAFGKGKRFEAIGAR